MTSSSISLAITGSGGAGVVVVGQLLLRAAGRAGLYGLMHRSAGPQIRGGESLSMLRISNRAVAAQDDDFDFLFAFDWKNFSRFMAEVPLNDSSVVFADETAGPLPGQLAARGFRAMVLPLGAVASSIKGGRPNMVLLGALAGLLDIDPAIVSSVAESRLGTKGAAVVDASLGCIEAGSAMELDVEVDVPVAANPSDRLWLISGNEAAGLGALHAGVRFVAAYPITPASDVLEWMAPRLEEVGGRMVQAEDELASINMTIGASWGGVPAMTATSGPGLALMTEALGLAVASETPVTVLDVMRGGPSTGVPTKSEQSDLNIALHGLHGDAPHLVTAPLSITDCAFTTAWTIGLAERLQVPAIVLSDQSLGQSQAVTDAPPLPERVVRKQATPGAPGYRRYAPTDDDVSPMAIPGDEGNMYTADGLEHDEKGTPSTVHHDHVDGLDKRFRKLEAHDYGNEWGKCDGVGDLVLLTWGSLCGAVMEAASRLQRRGYGVRIVALRLLSPLPVAPLSDALRDGRRIVVIEQNHGAQLMKHLRAYGVLDGQAESFSRPGPLPIRPGEIVRFVTAGQA